MIRFRMLCAALLMGLPASAALVSVFNATPAPGCEFAASQSGSPYASATIGTNNCFWSPVTVTASESDWTAGVSVIGGFGDLGSASAFASLDPVAIVLGGAGSGFLSVQYTGEINSGSLWCCSVNLAAGGISAGGPLSASQSPYSLSGAMWSGYIPFTFGDPVALPPLWAELSFDVAQSSADGWARESVSGFDIRDANMNPIDGAYAIPAPEPSGLWLCLGGACFGLCWRRKAMGRG